MSQFRFASWRTISVACLVQPFQGDVKVLPINSLRSKNAY